MREKCAACGQRIVPGDGPPICQMCFPGYEHGRAAGYAEAIEKAAGICQTYAAGASGSSIDNPVSRLSTASFLEDQIRALAPADKERT